MNKSVCLPTPLPAEVINLLKFCLYPNILNNKIHPCFNLHLFLVKLSIFSCLLTICISFLIVHFLANIFDGWFIFFFVDHEVLFVHFGNNFSAICVASVFCQFVVRIFNLVLVLFVLASFLATKIYRAFCCF